MILICCIGLTYAISAQKITPSVISNAGNVVKNATHSIEWTLGEFMTETIRNNNGSITQGFHQANLLFTAIDQTEIAGLDVFPNPVSQSLTVQNLSDGALDMQINHITGAGVYQSKIANGIEKFDFSNYPAGVYLIQFSNASGTKTYKIEKQ